MQRIRDDLAFLGELCLRVVASFVLANLGYPI